MANQMMDILTIWRGWSDEKCWQRYPNVYSYRKCVYFLFDFDKLCPFSDLRMAQYGSKTVQIITIPISGILALASAAIKIQKKDLTKHLPKRLHSKIITIFKVRDCVFLLLMFTSGLHERYVGHVGDEYVLARAQVFLLMFNCGLMAISEYNIGFSDQFKRL